jgi:single-strand DNA-binding protein
MNNCVIIGRLVKDVELRYLQSGTAIANGTIAVRRDKEKTDFINITIAGITAENTANYTAKGSMVAVKGSIQTDTWDGKDGKKQYKTYVFAERVEFLDK